MAKFDKCRFVRDDESQNPSNCLTRNLPRHLPSRILASDLNETPKLATS